MPQLMATLAATPTPDLDAVGRWSVVMMGLILFALALLVMGLVVVAVRRSRRARARTQAATKGGLDPWVEAGRRAAAPPVDDGPDQAVDLDRDEDNDP